MAVPTFVEGREAETATLEAALAALPRRGDALVVEGEAGIGKSVLLEHTRELAEARGFRTLRAAGVESEAALAFSGLHRLVRPELERLGSLPERHRNALASAFGIGEAAEAPDPFLVALAALELLSAAAADGPLAVLVDDIHWLDQPSREALGFVARRVESDPILMVFALRDGYQAEVPDFGLRTLRVEPLSTASAERLLDVHAPDLREGLRTRVLEEAAGNPLALVELPRALASAAPSLREAEGLPLSTRLERTFSDRFDELPPETAAVVLSAAAEDSAAIGEVLAAAELVLGKSLSVGAVEPAVRANLISLSGSFIQFRHPLVRSAVYQGASFEARAEVHRAFAEVFADEPDRRAWHRAEAATVADDDVAKDLEAMAQRIAGRGAALQAAIALGRAAHLSVSGEDRARRLLAAAELAFEVGRGDLVQTFVEEARALALDWRSQARAEWLSEIFHDGLPGDTSRITALVDLAERAHDDDPGLALTLVRAAGLRSWWGDPGAETRNRVVEVADLLSEREASPDLIAAIAMAQPLRRSAEVMSAVASMAPRKRDDPDALLLLGQAAHAVGDYDASLRLLRAAGDALRVQGRLGVLTHAVGMFASGAVFVGDWPVAAGAAAEYESLARETGQTIWSAGAAVMQCAVAGVRGDQALAESYSKLPDTLVDTSIHSDILCVLQNSRGLVALAAGRYDEAFHHLARIFDPLDAAYHHREKFVAVANLAEAAVLSGRRSNVWPLIENLTQEANTSAERALLDGLFVSRAILAPEEQAEAEFEEAFRRVRPASAFAHARLSLYWGAWLRRRRRMMESREPLRQARDTFDRLGAPAWASRARQELRASGESSSAPEVRAWDQLSPQELQIARLAASGLSNREIGQRLYLSHRTVASHLYRIFPKLGITSRRYLSEVLPRDEEPGRDERAP